MSSAKLYDCLIIGGGPADFLLRRVSLVHNILTRDGIHPAELRKIAREQISAYNMTDFVDTKITKAANKGHDGKKEFELSDGEGQTSCGRTVIFATGCKDVFPAIEGYEQNWPHNIYQYLFCDGHERSHLPESILTLPSPMYLKLASTARHQSTKNSTVTIFTDGPPSDDPAIQKGLEAGKALALVIEQRKIRRLEKSGHCGVNVVLEDREKVYMGFLVHKPATMLVAEDLVDQLGIETEQNATAKMNKTVEPWGATNVQGALVAGDAGTFITAVTTAMAQGASAAGAVTHQLDEEDDEIALE